MTTAARPRDNCTTPSAVGIPLDRMVRAQVTERAAGRLAEPARRPARALAARWTQPVRTAPRLAAECNRCAGFRKANNEHG